VTLNEIRIAFANAPEAAYVWADAIEEQGIPVEVCNWFRADPIDYRETERNARLYAMADDARSTTYWPERVETASVRGIVYKECGLEGDAESWKAEVYSRTGGSIRQTIGPACRDAATAVRGLVLSLLASAGSRAQAAAAELVGLTWDRVPIRPAGLPRPEGWEVSQ